MALFAFKNEKFSLGNTVISSGRVKTVSRTFLPRQTGQHNLLRREIYGESVLVFLYVSLEQKGKMNVARGHVNYLLSTN
jgi:hypothetical protein